MPRESRKWQLRAHFHHAEALVIVTLRQQASDRAQLDLGGGSCHPRRPQVLKTIIALIGRVANVSGETTRC